MSFKKFVALFVGALFILSLQASCSSKSDLFEKVIKETPGLIIYRQCFLDNNPKIGNIYGHLDRNNKGASWKLIDIIEYTVKETI